MRRGIIMAGGKGSRLYPVTMAVSKQMLPIYDKPMIYYPLSVLMLAGIREILIISTPQDIPLFEKLLGNGSSWGIHLTYKVQNNPGGLAEAFILGEEFLAGNSCAMILGDNIFYGNELSELLQKANKQKNGATVFAYHVNDPERYGVVQFDRYMKPVRIVEKPKTYISKYAVTGLYFYDNHVVGYAKDLKPSCRNELEIADINQRYLEEAGLSVEILGRGMAWLDTGTFESLLEASLFVETVQNRQGLKIACLEEVAYHMGFIEIDQIKEHLSQLGDNSYKQYLVKLIEEMHENS